jgi:hypothetical protein
VEGASLPTAIHEWPVPKALESQVTSALSASPAEKAAVDARLGEATAKDASYQDLGVVRLYKDVILFLAVRNVSRWTIRTLVVDAWVPDLLNSSTRPFDCQELNSTLEPQQEAVVRCPVPNDMGMKTVMDGVRAAMKNGSSLIAIHDLKLDAPRVILVDKGRAGERRFVVTGGTARSDLDEDVPSQLASLDCAETATCATPFEAASLALFELFERVPILIPIPAGFLMGVFVGGFSRRPYRVGTIVVMSLFLCVGLAGFVLLGAYALVLVVALPMWLLAMYLGSGAMRLITRQAEPLDPRGSAARGAT